MCAFVAGYFSGGRCSCYTESHTEGGREWSEIELRAKASYVDESAVTYLARAALTRAKANDTSPLVWVPGGSAVQNYVLKWVPSSALQGQLAHVVDGWRPDRPQMLLESMELEYFRGTRPAWWPAQDESWLRSPNNTDDSAWWASVCTSACIRDFRDDVRLVFVDLDATPARCDCYAWSDPDLTDGHHSHSSPSDPDILRFLEGASRDTVVTDRVSLYAVSNKVHQGHYFGSQQSTVFHAQILNDRYIHGGNFSSAHLQVVDSLDLCFEECGTNVGLDLRTIAWLPAQKECLCFVEDFQQASHGVYWNLRGQLAPTVEYYRADYCPNVRVGSERSLVWSKSSNKTCHGDPVVSGFTLGSHSLLSSVGTSGSEDSSVPFDARCESLCEQDERCEMAHVFSQTFDFLDLSTPRRPPSPIALRPTPRARRQPQAAAAEPPDAALLASALGAADAALPPRGESLPAPPLCRAASLRATPSCPSQPPPDERSGWRAWAPSALRAPAYDADLKQYVISCEVEGCAGPIPIWRAAAPPRRPSAAQPPPSRRPAACRRESGSSTSTAIMARELMQKDVFKRSVCPYECERRVVRHGLGTEEENNVIDGAGLVAAAFEYESSSESPHGLSTFEVRSDRVRGTLVRSLWREPDLGLEECAVKIQKRRLVCPHGLWLHTSTSSTARRLGDCVCALASRSKLQASVTRAFFRHASSVTSLPHFQWTHEQIRVALTSPADGLECDAESSRLCLFWSEFDLDEDSELGCYPTTGGDNVVTPQVILESLLEAGVEYPPPSPPPPSPPSAPPAPVQPPSPYTCSAKALPSAEHVKDHSGGLWDGAAPHLRTSRSVPCWRWDEGGAWPPRQAHQVRPHALHSTANPAVSPAAASQDVFEELEVCGWQSSRSIRWADGFRQPILDSILRNRFNDDSCYLKEDGVCQDGGDGDFQSSASHVYKPKSARTIAPVNGRDAFEFERIETYEPLPAVGSHLMISLVDYWDALGSFGDTVNYGDSTVTESFESCFGIRGTWPVCVSRDDHPMVGLRNQCLNGFHDSHRLAQNAQTGPLEVTKVETYSENGGTFIRITAIAVETGYVEASGGRCWEGCGFQESSPLGCGPCDGYAQKHHPGWTSADGFDCLDVTGVILQTVQPQCSYGTDRTDCGDREDIVSYGYSSFNHARVAYDWTDVGPITTGGNTKEMRAGYEQHNNGFCNDAGGDEFMSTLFGTDSGDCGTRHLTLPASKTGVKVPDDSCATAGNGRCEDQLFFSVIFPNGNRGSSIAKCAPNTGARPPAPAL